MKTCLPMIAALLLSTIPGLTKDEKTISLEGISHADQIIGHLGKPLGTVMKVRGAVKFSPVPDKKDPHPKGGIDQSILVTHVNDTKLPKPIELEIFPTSPSSLVHGETIEARAYERVMTYGTPKELPMPMVQARSSDLEFHLRCYLHIVDEEAVKAEQEGKRARRGAGPKSK